MKRSTRLRAPLLVGGEHDLGVGVRAELVAEPLELGPQLAEVVELAVVGDDERAAAARHRHVARRRRVDDRESAVREADRPVDEMALVVRAAVGDHRAHASQHFEGNRRARPVQDAGDAAHGTI